MVRSIAALILLLTAAPAVPATAQTSQPATAPSWNARVEELATALCDPGTGADRDAVSARSLIAPDAIVRHFNHPEREDVLMLLARSRGMSKLAARGYASLPASIASDIAADVKDADLPALVKRRLTPADDNEEKHANLVGGKWVAAALGVKGDEPIGYILLWQSTSAAPATKPATQSTRAPQKAESHALPLFILIKGKLVGDNYIVQQIAYGDPIGGEASH